MPTHAQVQSPAFDPECYQPRLGNPKEIDTLYTSNPGQMLGRILMGIPEGRSGSPRRLLIGGMNPPPDTVKLLDPIFADAVDIVGKLNMHKLSHRTERLDFNGTDLVLFGHFRSPILNDALELGGQSITLYLADSSGDYDTSRVIRFDFPHGFIRDSTVFYSDRMLIPYIGHFTSDSLDDVVIGERLSKVHTTAFDSIYIGIIHGSPWLVDSAMKDPYKYKYVDSFCVVDAVTALEEGEGFWGVQADYRGTGRDDYIAFNRAGNAFFYANDGHFSLAEFAQALREDTVFTRWQNPDLEDSAYGVRYVPFYFDGVHTAVAFPRDSSDHSVDLLAALQRKSRPGTPSIYFFRGGKDFGKHRIYLDSADYELHPPGYYDDFLFGPADFPQQYVDVGDINGTGNHALFVDASLGNAASLAFVYEMGTALDDKVDMYLGIGNSRAIWGVSSLDANQDGLSDIIFSVPSFVSNAEVASGDYHGLVGVIYGSKKVPPAAVREQPTIEDGDMSISVVPDGSNVRISFVSPKSGHCSIRLRNILGAVVATSEVDASAGETVAEVNTRQIADGVYLIEVSMGETMRVKKLVLVR